MLNLSIVLPKIECEAKSQQYGRFVIGPLESGYGVTLGNALRRVLLSSLTGAAVSSIRIEGVHHEFSPIPHVREDTTGFILNVKQLRVKSVSNDPVRVSLQVNAEGPVTAGDLVCPPEIEIINPDLLLLTADSNDVDLFVELVIRLGRRWARFLWTRSSTPCVRHPSTWSALASVNRLTLIVWCWRSGPTAPSSLRKR